MKLVAFRGWLEVYQAHVSKGIAVCAFRQTLLGIAHLIILLFVTNLISAKCITKWHLYIKQRSSKRHQRALAQQIRDYHTQRAHFAVWYVAYKGTEKHRRCADAAVQAKQVSLVKRCFGLWIRYWHSRKVLLFIYFMHIYFLYISFDL